MIIFRRLFQLAVSYPSLYRIFYILQFIQFIVQSLQILWIFMTDILNKELIFFLDAVEFEQRSQRSQIFSRLNTIKDKNVSLFISIRNYGVDKLFHRSLYEKCIKRKQV